MCAIAVAVLTCREANCVGGLGHVSTLLKIFVLVTVCLYALVFTLVSSPITSSLLGTSVTTAVFIPIVLCKLLVIAQLLGSSSGSGS